MQCSSNFTSKYGKSDPHLVICISSHPFQNAKIAEGFGMLFKDLSWKRRVFFDKALINDFCSVILAMIIIT